MLWTDPQNKLPKNLKFELPTLKNQCKCKCVAITVMNSFVLLCCSYNCCDHCCNCHNITQWSLCILSKTRNMHMGEFFFFLRYFLKAHYSQASCCYEVGQACMKQLPKVGYSRLAHGSLKIFLRYPWANREFGIWIVCEVNFQIISKDKYHFWRSN